METPDKIVLRIAQMKGVDPLAVLNWLMQDIWKDHTFQSLAETGTPTILEHLVKMARDSYGTVLAAQGRDELPPEAWTTMLREHEALFLILQEMKNASEHTATDVIVRTDEEEGRSEGR